MTLLLREVVGLLVGTLVWLAVVVALCAVPGMLAARFRPTPSGTTLRAALLGGLLAAGLSARLGVPDPALFTAAARPVPALWTLAGASVGVLLAALGNPPLPVSDRTGG